ncbi:MAG: Rhodanese-like domain protein [Pelotomaculum sp. PtaB.Bin013]|nr:MAG: Rhodanese-like domain protein [Pelotomaculum sp. PtaB.Bin013]
MRKYLLLMLSIIILVTILGVAPNERAITVLINGNLLSTDIAPVLQDGRVLVPIRALAEAMGARVNWDNEQAIVHVDYMDNAESYLNGVSVTPLNGRIGIAANLIKAIELKKILDDDEDGDLADYRTGHSGGDNIANDPLIVDLRSKSDYEIAHIPGAVWVNEAAYLASKESELKLRALLVDHVQQGGKNEIVVYCYTGHTAGLVAGVLGARGINIRNLMYGFDNGWLGAQINYTPVQGPVESCGG